MTTATPSRAPRVPAGRRPSGPAGAPDRGDLRRKRAFDLLLGSLLVFVCVPLLIILALGVWCSSGRPVLFCQRRDVGRGRSARILKLRTLTPQENPDSRWAVDERDATGFGRWLRTTHLDELPQLANVLAGTMSLVGPRPERPYFAEMFSTELPGYAARNRMPSGITGWAQVHGLHGDTSIPERARFDNDYIEHWSLRLDLRILARTLWAGLLGLAGTGKKGDAQ